MWKPINGFEGKYEVSDEGRIRSIRRGNPKLLKVNTTKNGYAHVGLVGDKRATEKRYWYSVHRLVAEDFIGPCPDGYVVNHKDENKLNNSLSNLEYLTKSENQAYGTRIDRIAEKLRKPVVRIGKDGGLRVYPYISDAAKEMCCSPCNIQLAALGINKTAKGYYWKYASTKEVL